jgi:hypothetical protein
MFIEDKDTDNYVTSKKSWEVIQQYIPRDKIIYCPFYCDGKQKVYLNELGFNNVIHEDKDFFKCDNDFDLIVDNPPFSKMKSICYRLKEIDKPFILIAPPRTLNSKYFQQLFKSHLQLIIPFDRPKFTHLNNEKCYTNPCGSIYFCYKMNLYNDLIFI